jgi:ribosomal subunit interface protein
MKFVNLDTSDAINQYVREKCSTLSSRIAVQPNRYKMKMTVRPDAKLKTGKIKTFHVTGAIKVARSAELRASTKHSNIRKAIDKVITSLEKQVRRSTEKKERSRSTVGKSMKPVRNYKWRMSVR